jgi:hypothetical protein
MDFPARQIYTNANANAVIMSVHEFHMIHVAAVWSGTVCKCSCNWSLMLGSGKFSFSTAMSNVSVLTPKPAYWRLAVA